ncbi:uncharacterized protein LODBEIA_P10040 [Lodderomyces beijingensis]|uniref:Uncharacterized protein n=1 Tax=Lodderomyces beijingensis TaxID=1775926 RepID=A0ABP0ZKH2_9ASCO
MRFAVAFAIIPLCTAWYWRAVTDSTGGIIESSTPIAEFASDETSTRAPITRVTRATSSIDFGASSDGFGFGDTTGLGNTDSAVESTTTANSARSLFPVSSRARSVGSSSETEDFSSGLARQSRSRFSGDASSSFESSVSKFSRTANDTMEETSTTKPATSGSKNETVSSRGGTAGAKSASSTGAAAVVTIAAACASWSAGALFYIAALVLL